MEPKKLISVIVPVYNIEPYLERCVHSIQNQTYTNLEIVLVDDGSTDHTGKLCDQLALKDARIKVYHKKNGGSSSARNLGMEKATGDYFGFVDSDDYIEPFMYETLMKAMEKFPVCMAQIGRREIAEDGTELPAVCTPPKQDTLCLGRDFLKELLLHRGDCSFCTKLVERELFTKHRFPLGVLNEDFSLLVELLAEGHSVALVKESGYFVFYRSGSNTRKESKDMFSRVYADCVDHADNVMKLVERDYPELKEVSFRFAMFQRTEYLLHIPIAQMGKENKTYQAIIKEIRTNIIKIGKNSYLTKKNKGYLLLFAIAPKFVRNVHKRIKHL